MEYESVSFNTTPLLCPIFFPLCTRVRRCHIVVLFFFFVYLYSFFLFRTCLVKCLVAYVAKGQSCARKHFFPTRFLGGAFSPPSPTRWVFFTTVFHGRLPTRTKWRRRGNPPFFSLFDGDTASPLPCRQGLWSRPQSQDSTGPEKKRDVKKVGKTKKKGEKGKKWRRVSSRASNGKREKERERAWKKRWNQTAAQSSKDSRSSPSP